VRLAAARLGIERSSTVDRARALLVALHVPYVMTSPIYAVTGLEGGGQASAVVVVPMALAILALQLRHSLAASRGERPRWWGLTFAALVALVYLPIIPLGWNWVAMPTLAIVSTAMLLRGRLRVVAVGAQLVPTAAVAGWQAVDADQPLPMVVFMVVYWMLPAIGAGFVNGSAWLVELVAELRATRFELARAAVARERLRLSHDLHDLLGQSLAAVSLKGDLARQVVGSDRARARAEIEGLTEVARRALRDMSAVTYDEHVVSLRREIDGAAALLAAARIDANVVEAELAGLAPAAEGVLAWATREGVTNLLRHSEATTCTITTRRFDGVASVEIVNDGAPPSGPFGGGLAGLSERAGALAGSVATEHSDDGRFRLLVQVPAANGSHPAPTG